MAAGHEKPTQQYPSTPISFDARVPPSLEQTNSAPGTRDAAIAGANAFLSSPVRREARTWFALIGNGQLRTFAGWPQGSFTVPPCVIMKSASSRHLQNITLTHCTGDTVLTRPKEQEAACLWEALRSRMLRGVERDPVRILGPVTLTGAPVVWKRA